MIAVYIYRGNILIVLTTN